MIDGIVARLRSLWRGLARRSDVEAEMHEEFRFHLDARVDDLVRGGLSRADAVRRAGIEFGSFQRFKDEARASRGLRLFDELAFSWLDVRLALRMLRRYPGLTVVGGLAMAFGIAAGVVGFEVMTQLVSPRLPLPESERIVGLQQRVIEESRVEPPLLTDFVAWSEELESVEDVAAFRSVGRNLILDGRAESIEVAEISASAFSVARVPPKLGRWLDAADETAGAPRVLVIGHDVWQTRFGGDPAVVGRVVGLGSAAATVVGVMPADFAFPVAHDFWVPLDRTRDTEPGLVVFGRLAHGVSIEQAEAELATIVARTAPVADAHTRQARIVPFTRAIFEPDVDFWIGVGFGNVFLLMLMVLACSNVALLLFARAVTREVELALKSALGASRARLMTQFFAEALVLSSLAMVIGLGVAQYGLQSFVALMEAVNGAGRLPFWTHNTLSSSSVAYAAALALLAASIAGVLPAIMVTRSYHRARLSQLTAGGAAATRIGGIWTALIVVQVAVTVLFPATALYFHRWAAPAQTTVLTFPAAEYMAARVPLGAGTSGLSASSAGIGATRDELARRLASEPSVLGVTFSSTPPGAQHEQAWFELDAENLPAEMPVRSRAGVASVAFDFFDVLDAPVEGRAFLSAEQRSAGKVVVVNRSFVEDVLGGRSPIGRSIRRAASRTGEPGPWYEVIGVAPPLGMLGNAGGPGVYFPLDPDSAAQYLIAHLRTDKAAFASLLRNVALEVDPDLQLHEIMRLDEIHENSSESVYVSRLLVVISAVALLLSLMSIYSVVDFTVSRRTREIGVRVALGAAPRSIFAAILGRPLLHVGGGIGVGGVLIVVTSSGMFDAMPTLIEWALIAGYVLLMGAVCMVACLVPTRRALRVHPVEALRGE
jgi:putative ABC transport system permease protein